MLTGLLPATSGSATIAGYDLVSDISTIRYIMGVCPQQNVIYGSLTFLEQLKLFATLKGVPRKYVNSAAEHMLREVGLDGCESQLSSKGSGGMKRKLCVGMALIGGSNIVFLDEPTSGMCAFTCMHVFVCSNHCVLTESIYVVCGYIRYGSICSSIHVGIVAKIQTESYDCTNYSFYG